MSPVDGPMRIARRLRAIETTKTELVRQVAEVFRGIQTGNEREMTETLGGVIALAYLLGHQLGVDLAAIDRAARTASLTLPEDDVDQLADFEHVQKYLSLK
ncbi:MazG-like family protein [Alicyclobacillus sp.]|uniref:MazG-like family protein n=1 Tax=Alicyclobacillus sp. TaxID=61169 RepID=UPI0025B99ACA|nr:MazG-like family protein [Alicyclobacillus sp.]MCL6516021.1 MazG-like family protein [Alicyclobacillus sp.]